MKQLLIIFIICFNIFAEDNNQYFKIHESIFQAIKNNECFKQNGDCFPYIIRLNLKEDVQKIRDLNNSDFNIENNLLKCNDKYNCMGKAEKLIELNITNFDNGSYQINYKYHPIVNLSDYFDEEIAKIYVNEILTNLIKKFGYSWETLGRYHHSPESDYQRNMNYYLKLYDFIKNKYQNNKE